MFLINSLLFVVAGETRKTFFFLDKNFNKIVLWHRSQYSEPPMNTNKHIIQKHKKKAEKDESLSLLLCNKLSRQLSGMAATVSSTL